MALFHHLCRRHHRRLTRFGAGMALLAAVAAPATAQTLNLQSGDNVTVSGVGTQGIYQGQPISNLGSTYRNSASTTFAVTASSGSTFTLGNGGTLLIDSTLNSTGGVGLYSYGTSTITGGSIIGTGPSTNGVNVVNGGTANISNGVISADYGVDALGGTATITGGTITGSDAALDVEGGTIFVSGGSITGGNNRGIDGLIVEGVTPFGGGGLLPGVIDLFGTFSQTAPITSGSASYVEGTVQGTLLDGHKFSSTYYVGNGGTIEFNVGTPPPSVPEFSSGGSLGVGLAFLGVLGLAGRRRARQSTNQ